MKAISIRQPWAWLVVNGFKDVENRTWATGYRGPVLIHAAAAMKWDEYCEAVAFISGFDSDLCRRLPRPHELQFGGIIGQALIMDCVRESESQWFTGPFGLRFANVQKLRFQAVRGALGLFEVRMEVDAEVGEVLRKDGDGKNEGYRDV